MEPTPVLTGTMSKLLQKTTLINNDYSVYMDKHVFFLKQSHTMILYANLLRLQSGQTPVPVPKPIVSVQKVHRGGYGLLLYI